ncbi:MAG: YggS family pyridoxal phosphate-dependent enzyme [Bacteroidetes bacterium]|nr:YggS family pyridoxal phosphate-dependent enzyme [Bacteroidota bacterium]
MIAENIQNIGENLKKAAIQAGRNPDDVKLIAVSKTFGADAVTAAMQAGIMDFGENYVQELTEKREALLQSGIRWHFIGHLQSNKVKYIADWVHLIHSVDSEGLAAEIDKRAARTGRTIEVLAEVNTSAEATKYGVKPEQALDLLKRIVRFPNIRLNGLMTIGPFTDDAGASRTAFRTLRELFQEANRQGIGSAPLEVLSMGMTHDYTAAIAEGSTMVRIGTAIFGSRTTQSHT